MTVADRQSEIRALGSTLLEIGALLMKSGANTQRIRITVDRISNAFGYDTDLMISQRSLTINIIDHEHDHFFSSLKRTASHGANFTLLSGISKMSWLVVEQKWTVQQIDDEIKRLAALPHYPRWIVLSMVGLAGAAFCRLAGGDWRETVLVFIGSFAGLFVRHEAVKHRFNPYLSVYFAAFISTLIVSIGDKFNVMASGDHALATSVLFLIPGVPFINSFSDMMDGNQQNGLARGVHCFIIAFSIAMGLLTSIFITQF